MSKKSTTDLYLAASFLALGATLEKVDKSDPRHMVFELSGTPLESVESPIDKDHYETRLDKWETQYANGILLVNAVQFKDAIQRLKSIVHTK